VDGVILTERWTQSSDIDHIAPAIAWFKSRSIPVIAVGPVQEYDVPLPMLLAFAIKHHDASLPGRHLAPGFVQLDQRLQARMAEWQVPYLSPLQTLCPAGHCREYVGQGSVPTLADDNHLTNQASVQIAKEWAAGGHFVEVPSMKDVAVTQPPLSAGTIPPIPTPPDQRRTIGDLRLSTIDILSSHGTRYGRGGS
jgi:hypothetical protein